MFTASIPTVQHNQITILFFFKHFFLHLVVLDTSVSFFNKQFFSIYIRFLPRTRKRNYEGLFRTFKEFFSSLTLVVSGSGVTVKTNQTGRSRGGRTSSFFPPGLQCKRVNTNHIPFPISTNKTEHEHDIFFGSRSCSCLRSFSSSLFCLWRDTRGNV